MSANCGCGDLLLFVSSKCAILLSTLFLIWYLLLELLQLGAAIINPDDPVLSADDLADQIAEVLDYFGYCRVTPFCSISCIFNGCILLVSKPVAVVLSGEGLN